jgi:hypothetical protein
MAVGNSGGYVDYSCLPGHFGTSPLLTISIIGAAFVPMLLALVVPTRKAPAFKRATVTTPKFALVPLTGLVGKSCTS